MAAMPNLVCPVCRGDLERTPDMMACIACGRGYPIVAGIPDLRVRGDRYLSLDEDRRKALELAAVEGDAVRLMEAYWERTPQVPAELARRYVASAAAGPDRAASHLDRLGALRGSLLDVGCGTGGLLVSAARRGARGVGVDIALRWLVVAQRRLRDLGLDRDVALIAADGAQLPFAAGSFDLVTCVETLDHAADQRGLLHSCLLATAPSGRTYVVVANRFSLAPEPTVGLWGVGYLPRRVATRYVAARRHTRYQHFRAISASEARAFLGVAHPARIGPAVLPAAVPGTGAGGRILRAAHGRLVAHPSSRGLLTGVGPYLEIHLDRRPESLYEVAG